MKILCLNCAKFEEIFSVRSIINMGITKCPRCGSSLLALVNANDDVGNIVRKAKRRRRLRKHELEKLQECFMSSELLREYGEKAVLALATRGVGPKTASSILKLKTLTKREFLERLMEAEKTYIRTRPFWGD